jgi:Immunity protein 50
MPAKEDVLLNDVPGFAAVKEWFGYWPSFHDAEIVSLNLERNSSSRLKVHAFHTVNETNALGHYRTTKHAVVCFMLDEIQDLNLVQFSAQNVISELVLSKNNEGYSIQLGCCYGLCGSLTAKSIRIELESGMPDSSIYGPTGTLQT